MEKRKGRRILALVLAVLMVISLILPGDLSSRERAYAAGEDDITVPFLRGVDLYEAGSSTPKDVAWLIDTDKTYGMHVNFSESRPRGEQFHMDAENHTFRYAFPAGVKIQQVHSPLTIVISDSIEVENNTYTATLVGDHYEITGIFNVSGPEGAAMVDSGNVHFYLDFDVQFDEGLTELDFGNNVSIPVQYDTESKVTVEKTGFYSTGDGKAHFTVTANSRRTNHNVHVKDTLTGSAFTGLTIDSITSGGADYSGSVTSDVTTGGFDITIPTMTDGQSVVINYSVDIDYSQISGDGTGTETGNIVDVTSNEDPDPDPVPYNLQNKITYASLGKGASSSSNSDGSKTITYTVNYNDYCIVPMNGVTLTDTINSTGITYPADLKLNILRYGKNGALVSEEQVLPASLSDTVWTYQLNDTTPYKYVITYEVTVPATEMTENKTINNTVEDNRGHKGTYGITVGPEALSLTKSVADVDAVNKEITWKLIVSVPEDGLGVPEPPKPKVDTSITDSVPANWVDGTEVVEHLVPGSLTLLSNTTGGALNYSVAEDADQKKFVISFPDGIANTTGTKQTVEFEYKTVISDEWVAKSATETWMQDHTNTAEIRSGGQTGRNSATAKVVPPTIKKNLEDKATDGSGYPVYKFEVVVANPMVPLILEDTFDPELELVTTDTSYAKAPRICSGNQYYQGSNETAILPGDISTGEGSFRMSLDQSYIYGSDTHYKITYALKVKSTGAYRRLAQRVADTGSDKLTLTNTAKVGDVTEKTDFDFEYSPVKKTLKNADQFPESGDGVSLRASTAQYEVVINPLGLTLNNGDPMTATDTYTNLALNYTTVSFDPADAGITCNATGNVLTIENIPDATPVTMTYSSRPSGKADADGKLTISNEFETTGHLAVSTKSFKVKADAGGAGDILHLNILKYEDGDLLHRLSGASFKLYDSSKNPVKWKATSSMGAPTEDVVITTNQNGIAVLSEYDVELKTSDDTTRNVYYLKEIKAPDGYMIKDTWYQFELIEGTDPDYTKFEYVDGDIMKIRNNKPNFYFTKVNENDEPLAGAEFTLYDESKTSLGITAVSDAQGIVSFTDLPIAATGDTTLYIKETAVPDPQYMINNTFYKIVYTHDADGNLREKERDIPARFPNTKDKPKTSLKVTKIWDDQDDKYSLRPASVDVQLKAAVTGAAATNVGTAVTLSEANNWTYTWDNLDKYDANLNEITYSVAETDETVRDLSVAYDSGNPVKVVDPLAANAYTITNTLKTGNIKVSKEFVFPTGVSIPNNAKFDLTFQVKRGDTVYATFTWTDIYRALSVGGTGYVVEGLPIADDYKVIETNAEGLLAAYNLVIDEANSTMTKENIAVTYGNTAEVSLTNTYKKLEGGIALKAFKNVDGSAVTAGSTYDGKFSFELSDGAGNVLQTKTNAANAVTFDAINYSAPGTKTYKITEKTVTGMPDIITDTTEYTLTVTVTQDATDPSKLTAEVTDVQKTTAAGTETVAYAGGVGITFNNIEVKKGDLRVSKVLVSDRAADADQIFTFTVTLDDTTITGTYGDMTFSQGVTTLELKGGEQKTAVGLPEGVGYTVTERDVDGFINTRKIGASGTIVDGLRIEVVFTNTRETGDLKVSKTVVSTTDADKQKDFEFTVTLDDTTINGTYGGMTFTNGVATFTLKDGETKTAVGLPTGVGYTVTETAADGFITTKTGETGTISTTESTAAFTNTEKEKEGTLKITKTIKGDVTPEEAAGQLQFTITDEAGDVLVVNGKRMENLILANDFTKNGDIYELELTVPAGQKYVVSEVIYDVDGAILASVTGNGVALDKENGIYSMLTEEVVAEQETVAAYEDTYKKGRLLITKTIKGDVTPEEADGQLEFTITNETTGISEVVNLTQFDFDQNTGIYSYEIEAKPGDIYTVTETDYDVDGAILETVTHSIMAGPEEEGATATGIEISKTEQTRVDFADDYKADEGVVHFTKYGYVNELCSPLADEIRPLKGVVFQAENTVYDNVVYYAQSDENGLVEFLPMPAGTYRIWEVHCPEEYVLDDTVYYVTIANGTVSEITTEDGTPIEKNRIINEPLRTDLEFTKVSEDEPTLTLEGSTYALFVESGDGSVSMIAQRTTDAAGKVKFEGVLPGRIYSIKEMTSPDGYYVSKNTVRITFKVDTDDQGEPFVTIDAASLDNGDGTVLIDAKGNMTWLEPVVVAKITKVTKDGKLLAGATLRVEDEDGNVIIPEWVTGAEETEISGKLIVGHTYRLVEVKAPAGYSLAGPITFTVPNDEVKPGEERVIKVSMIDEELPPDTPPETPPTTNDDSPILPVAGLMALSLAGATVVGTKKRKLKKDSKK